VRADENRAWRKRFWRVTIHDESMLRDNRFKRVAIPSVALVMLMAAPSARAQQSGTVTGRVADQTGAALPGVAIDLVTGATELNAVSDGSGAYTFDDVAAGPAQLTFRLINFSVLRRNLLIAAGRPATADVVLMLSLSADVIVTGASTFRNIADLPNPAENVVGIATAASQGAVTMQQLELRPLMRTGEVLETVPGMIVSQHSGEGKANQ
jgi:hypothetical protein